ncbi:MAG: histidine kinase [Pseudomonadota bacterium]
MSNSDTPALAPPVSERAPINAIPRGFAPWRSLWLVGFVWSVTSLGFMAYWAAWYANAQVPLPWYRLVALGVLDWSFWLLATPAILAVAHRFPPVRLRNVLSVHLPLSLFCAAAAIILSVIIRLHIEPVDQLPYAQPPFQQQVLTRWVSEGAWYNLFYWFVIGAYFAVDYHTALRRSEHEGLTLQLHNETLQRGLVEARLGVLRAQLQPHFLFNALHSVSSLMDVNVPQAREMLIDLADILRRALHMSEQQTHTLADEFDWLEAYLRLEAVRFGDGLKWDTTLAQSVSGISVPCLITQPLVENALKHGRRRGGEAAQELIVQVTAEQTGEEVTVRVTDNGPGITSDSNGSGHGLRFVRELLNAYPHRHGSLTLERAAPQGTCATVHWRIDPDA